MPAGHDATHASAPATELPEAHAAHEVLPTVAAKVPIGHGVQAALPEPTEKLPAGHAEHVVTAPADVTGLARYCPGGQGVHVATVGLGYVPGAQYELSAMPSTSSA